MADITKTVEILFTGEDNLSGKMDSIRSGFSSLDESVSSITGPLATMAEGVLAVEAALTALATGALVYSVDKAIAFQNATIELDKVLSEEEGLAGALSIASEKAIELSETYGQSSTEILNSMANFKQAGFDVEDAMTLTANAMDLVIAGGLDAADASDLLVASLKGFKAPAEEAGRLVDILNKISNEYATNVEELAKGMSGLSPIANQMGLSFEETAGILTPVIEVFRSGDEAAVALKTGLLKLIDDSKPVQEALQSIGVSQRDANGELRSGKDILYDVMAAFDGLTDSEKLFVTQQLVGVEQAARMVEVFDQGNKVMAVTETALNSAGSAAEEVAKRLESAEVQIDRFKTTFENLATAVGTNFLDATAKAAGGATELNQAIRQAVDEGSFDPLFKVIENVGLKIGEKFEGIAKAMPEALANVDWSKLTKSIEGLTGEIGSLFEALFGDVDLTKSEDLAKVIQNIINAIAGLTNVTTGIVEAWGKFIEKTIKPAIDAFIDLDSSTQQVSGSTMGWGQIIDGLLGPIGSLLNAFDAIGVSLGIMAASTAAKTISEIGSSASSAGGLLNTFGGILTQSIGSATAGQTLGVMGLGYAVGYAAGKLLEEFVPGVKDASNAVADWLVDVLDLTDGQEDINDSLETTAKNLEHMEGKFGEIGAELDDLNSKDLVELKVTLEEEGITIEEFNAAIEALPEEKKSEVILLLNQGKFDEAMNAIGEIPEEKTLGVVADGRSVDELATEINAKFPDEKEMDVKPAVDQPALDKATKTIEEKIPLEKQMEIEAKVNIANIEAEAKKVEAAFEAMGKLGVAQIEADAEKYVAAIESISTVAESTSDLLGNLFGLWGEADTLREKWDLEHYIEEQLDIQREQLDLQKGLVEEQIKYYQSRREALDSGEALIKVEAEGLEPELEAFMWKILEKVQLRVQEEQAEFLLGLDPGSA